MIPIRLEFSGLASYQERVSIDFSTLVSGKLFGIFGPVGSGKSAILDAMSYVLYGETDRLGSSGSAYNLMNLQSQAMEIEFEFALGSQRYLFTYTIKRRKNDFTKLGNGQRSAYRWQDESWVPFEESGKGLAERILGMGYDNFRRTVIIPQGKFQELLHISGSDRTKMMQNLFRLDQYDLSDGVSRKLTENSEELIKVRTRLDSLGSITEQHLLEKKHELVKLEKEVIRLKKELEQSRRDERFFQEFQTLSAEQKEQKSQLVSRQEQLERGQVELAKMELDFSELQARCAQHSKEEIQLKELQRYLQWKEQEANLICSRNEAEKVSKQLADVEAKELALNQEIAVLQHKRKKLENHLISTDTLMEISGWFQEQAHLERSLEQEAFQFGQLSVEEQHQLERWLDRDLLDTSIYKQMQEELEKSLQDARGRLQQISVDQRLEELSHNLIAGEPCPVCGSLNHPKVEKKSTPLDETKQHIELEISKTQISLSALESAHTQQHAKKELEAHLKTFQWQELCPMDQNSFTQLRSQQTRYNQQISNINKQVEDLQKEHSQMQRTHQQLTQRKERLAVQAAELEGISRTFDENLLANYTTYDVPALQNLIEERGSRIAKERATAASLESKQKGHREGIAKVQGIIENLESRVTEIEARLAEIQPKAEKLLYAYKIPSLSEWSFGDIEEPIREEYEDVQVEYRDLERQIQGDTEALRTVGTLKVQLKELEEREARLKILQKLFRGKGFVNYVSQRYLSELCSRANERFVLFSRNAMRMELDTASGDIMVRDHYNHGHLRSIKTLSGGQTFQAAFSFALAMVEMIGRGKENFFFLDEGFGTLDQEALEIVFGTLSSMYKEQKIVGIISHVEALKEEIPVYLEVSTKTSGGSSVELVIR